MSQELYTSCNLKLISRAMLYAIIMKCILFVDYTKGELISIQNAGFEDTTDCPVVPVPPNTYYTGGDIIVDWDNIGSSSISTESGIGNYNEGTTFDDPVYADGSPEGDVSAYISVWDSADVGDGEMGIEQRLTGNRVTADTTYTLSAWIGNPKYNCYSDGGCYNPDGFPGYRVQLLAGTTVLSEDNDELTIAEGHWALSQVTYNVSPGDTNIGTTLRIRLIYKNSGSGGEDPEVCFDNVELTAVQPTPLPTLNPLNSAIDPTPHPTTIITDDPTEDPSKQPTKHPTNNPTINPTKHPTNNPTHNPTNYPSIAPTAPPSSVPTVWVFDTTSEAGEKQTNEGGEEQTNEGGEEQTNEGGEEEHADINSDASTSIGIVGFELIVGVSCAVLVCLLMLWVYCCCKRRNHKITIDVEEDELIRTWLTKTVGLGIYADIFITNGYDDVAAVVCIETKQQLVDIGINMKGHLTLLMSEIEKLRQISQPKKKTEINHQRKDFFNEFEGVNESPKQVNISVQKVIPSMIAVQSLSNVVALQSLSKVNVFVEEDTEDDKDEMAADDELIMEDIDNFINKNKITIGSQHDDDNDEFIVDDSDATLDEDTESDI